jgi:radical SAM protein with 4Fe4S-binding SPASM domain
MSADRKRCSWVHDGMVVTPNGDVYACCHHKPGIVGNINEQPLEDIFNGDRIKEFRRQELEGTLPCVKGCTILQSKTIEDDIHHEYRGGFQRLQIEFGERCNIRCVMCPQDHKNTLELDPEIIVRNIELPQSCVDIRFYGGTAITEEMAAKMALHAKLVSFSLNAATKETHEIVNEGSRFDKVIRNIKRLAKAKKDLDGQVVIVGHMTIVEQNIHEIAQFIAKKDEFGFQVINFGFDWRVPRLLKKDPALKARLTEEIRAALEHALAGKPPYERMRIQTERLQMLGLVTVDPRAEAEALEDSRKWMKAIAARRQQAAGPAAARDTKSDAEALAAVGEI